MKVKFCGLRRMEDIQAANRLAPDYVGFVFAPSKRRVTPAEAADLARALDPAIRRVGVFVDAPLEELAETARAVGLQVIQLHGNEPEALIHRLRQALPEVEIWRAVRLRDRESLLQQADTAADMLLIDAFAREAAGGTGKTADWDLLASCHLPRPFVLAGGLSAANLPQAVERVRPWGVDLSSGIETDSYKDPRKMEEVLAIIRNHQGGTDHE